MSNRQAVSGNNRVAVRGHIKMSDHSTTPPTSQVIYTKEVFQHPVGQLAITSHIVDMGVLFRQHREALQMFSQVLLAVPHRPVLSRSMSILMQN